MKLIVAFAAIVAVAVASPVKFPTPVAVVGPGHTIIEPVLVENPIVGPAIIGPGHTIIESEGPISVGPAVVTPGDIAVGPAIIDFPIPDGGAVSAPVKPTPPVVPSPVVIGELDPNQPTPLVQIIVNVNQAGLAPPAPGAVADVVGPVEIVDLMPVVDVEGVQVVDTAPVIDASPVEIVDLMPVVDVDGVQVVDVGPVVDVSPVDIVDVMPVVDVDVSPVQVVDIAPVVDNDAVNVVDITPGVAPEPVHIVDTVVDAVLVNTPAIAPIHH